MSVTIPGFVVELVLASSAWFLISLLLWRITRTPAHTWLQKYERRWVDPLMYGSLGPIGWCLGVKDYFDRKKSRAARRSIIERHEREHRERHPEAYPPEHPNCRSTLDIDEFRIRRWPQHGRR